MSTTIVKYFLLLMLAISINLGYSQDKMRTLPSNINRPSINVYAPFISGDGQTLIFLSDYTDDGHHGMRWATKKTVSTWNDPLEVTKLINRPTLNYRGGYSLSFDGTMMLFTSRKSGLGGFDLWYSTRRGNDWEAPKNFGSPINGRENDGAGMLSPDGEYLYFMRCETMSEYGGANGCRLLVAKRGVRGWEEPVELPANINTGNSQTPRILADGETLIFASDKFGGKGGLDLYMTTKSGDGWSDPMPLDFINTDKNDQFISIPAKGRYLYKDRAGSRDQELVQVLIPDEFRPKRLMRIQGEVIDGITGEPINANLTVFNIADRDRLWNEKVGARGEFAIVLKEGAAYDISVDVDDASVMYYSKVYDLEEDIGPRDKENLRIELMPIVEGMVFNPEISFEEYSAKIDDNSTFELRRIAEMLRKNPAMSIEITTIQPNYKEDSLQSDPDLTEIRVDTIYSERSEAYTEVAIEEDDTEDFMEDSEEELEEDDEDEYEEVENDYNEVIIESATPGYEIKKTYHNDRTNAMAEAIQEYLVGRGVSPDRMKISTLRQSSDHAEASSVVKIKILTL